MLIEKKQRLNPYTLSVELNKSLGFNTLCSQELIITVSRQSYEWTIEGKSATGNIVIRPTRFNTIEFNVPLVTIKLDKNISTNLLTSLSESLDGNIIVLSPPEYLFKKGDPNADKSMIVYTTTFPADIEENVEQYMQIILEEIESVVYELDQLHELNKQTQLSNNKNPKDVNLFKADNFNKNFTSSGSTTSSPKGENNPTNNNSTNSEDPLDDDPFEEYDDYDEDDDEDEDFYDLKM